MQIDIKVPQVVVFGELSQLNNMEDNLRLLNSKLRVQELDVLSYGFEFPGVYHGLVFMVGSKPKKQEIKNMLTRLLR